MLKLFSLLLLFTYSLLFTLACSQAKTSEPAIKKEEASGATEAKFTISGHVQLVGVPTEGMTACEVIVVSQLEPAVRQRIERQRELLEYKLTGTQPEVTQVDAYGMKEEDYVSLQGELADLKKGFPGIRAESFSMKSQNGRSQKLSANVAKHKEYKYVFDSITFDNFERALPFIGEKLKSDNMSLVEEADKGDEATYYQNKLTLAWLSEVAALFNNFNSLKGKVLVAKNSYVAAKNEAASEPQAPQDWDGYSTYYQEILMIDVSASSLGAAMVNAEGNFTAELEDEGELIVRVEYAPNSAYFIISEDEKRVRIDNLVQSSKLL